MNKRQSIFFSAIAGNILEYYEFTVYSVLALDIGRAFFPQESHFVQVLSSLAVFAIGFLTRPIGGVIFGYIGDRFGRRLALIISMIGMTLSTFTIGFIPTYSDVGYYAPIILVMMRLIQGMCISGEGAGAAIFILEHYQKLRPGFTGGLVHGSNIAGTLLASFVGIILNKYFSNYDFAWRFAFIFGGVMGMIGFYLRLRVAETPIFENLAAKKQTLKAPFIHVLKTAKTSMFITFCLGGVASSIVYMVKTYVNLFFCNVMHLDTATALVYLSYASFIMMISMPISGYISDHIGRFNTITLSAIAILLLSLPSLYMMSSPLIWQRMVALTTLAILGGAISGTAYVFIISLYEPEQRFSGVGFSYNLGIAMFGGTAAFISSLLVEKTGLFYAPAFYLMSTSSIFLLVIYTMRNQIKELIDKNMQEQNN